MYTFFPKRPNAIPINSAMFSYAGALLVDRDAHIFSRYKLKVSTFSVEASTSLV